MVSNQRLALFDTEIFQIGLVATASGDRLKTHKHDGIKCSHIIQNQFCVVHSNNMPYKFVNYMRPLVGCKMKLKVGHQNGF